jgi:pimeloyl-ACP methyl ester carboxylesterase
MARDAIAFLAAMEFGQADVLGFSIGSFVAQDIALIRPSVMRRLILASSAPQGAAGMHGWVADVIDAAGVPEADPERVLDVFNTRSPSSRHAGEQAFQRMYARTQDRDQPTTWTTRQAQYDAVCAWGIPDHALLQRPSAISQPVFVANGDSDPMILPHYSYLLAGLIPQAQVRIYPDSAHGFPVPAPHRVRRRCRGIPQRSGPGPRARKSADVQHHAEPRGAAHHPGEGSRRIGQSGEHRTTSSGRHGQPE